MKLFRRLLEGVLLCAILLASVGVTSVSATEGAEKTKYNRYNIVLVTDASGSMRSTDKDGLRFEAIGKFVALLAEHGNRVGSVVFNGGLAFKQDLADANGIAEKKTITSNIQSINADGYTNIGLGLQTATEMLNKDKNPALPSIILLLSDGNSELSTQDELDVSLTQKAEAIDAARNAGYKIYTVILNADGSANADELAQIAKATGGEFREVNEASDLEDVFSMYYTMIFSSKLEQGDIRTFPASGETSDTFTVPGVGVEEVNIVLSGKATDYSLTDPTGKVYDKNALGAFTYSSGSFNVIKIVDPLAGDWGYSVKGIPGDQIQINIVYNTDLSTNIQAEPEKDVYMANDQIKIVASLLEGESNATSDQYTGFKATLSVDNGKGETKAYDMTVGANGFEYLFLPPKSGSYVVRANIVGQDYDLYTENIKLDVDNTPPSKVQDIEKTVLLWPFSDNQVVIDVLPAATDAQDATLRYEVESTAFMDSEYDLQGSNLTMKSYSLSKGSFTIRAYDSDGAYCTFNVTIDTINMGLLGIVLLVAGILIAGAIIGFGFWIAMNKRFMGACYVTQFDDEGNSYEEVKREKGRGRIMLSAFNLKSPGFNTSKAYFQATGKDHAFLCTREKVYGDGRLDKSFRVDGNGYEVTITADEGGRRGLRVRFVSRMNNVTGGF